MKQFKNITIIVKSDCIGCAYNENYCHGANACYNCSKIKNPIKDSQDNFITISDYKILEEKRDSLIEAFIALLHNYEEKHIKLEREKLIFKVNSKDWNILTYNGIYEGPVTVWGIKTIKDSKLDSWNKITLTEIDSCEGCVYNHFFKNSRQECKTCTRLENDPFLSALKQDNYKEPKKKIKLYRPVVKKIDGTYYLGEFNNKYDIRLNQWYGSDFDKIISWEEKEVEVND